VCVSGFSAACPVLQEKHINICKLLYYPPYHSKYYPIERCREIPEKHWNITKLTDAETMLKWAGSMTRKGIYHIVKN